MTKNFPTPLPFGSHAGCVMSVPLSDNPQENVRKRPGLSFDMEWARPEYSRNQVDKAAVIYLKPFPDFDGDNVEELRAAFEESTAALGAINNWRAAHSYPLNCFQTNLRARARKISTRALVSQRLKRFESILMKLRREQTSSMRLSRMQDIGGCRAVMKDCSEVYRLVNSYKRQINKKFIHNLLKEKDYISSPKPDGYRSIHLVFQWVGPKRNTGWDGLRIEVQIRSIGQHAWATALETVDILTRQALKANKGQQKWARFFALASSAIAIKEGKPTVPGTPTTLDELRPELASLTSELNVLEFLQGFSHGIQRITAQKGATNTAYYLLHLSVEAKRISWTPYGWRQSQEANDAYTNLEQALKNSSTDHVVLVKAGSLSAIKRAYPSFFLDTGYFVNFLRVALAIPYEGASAQRINYTPT